MKTVVSLPDVAEWEVKPAGLLDEFYALTAAEAPQWLLGARRTTTVNCPGCGSRPTGSAFEKLGFSYHECPDCASLFVSPRPREDALTDYYRTSAPARFWRDRILPATQAARLDKLVRPRAQWVLDNLAEHAPGAANGLDYSSHGSAFVEELLRGAPTLQRVTASYPTADLDFAAPGLDPRAEATPATIEGLASRKNLDFATAFDALDRAPDPEALLRALREALAPGGLLFVTAPSASGFDIQVLRERSRMVTPPDKLNVLSTEGLAQAVERARLGILEVSTPGAFDVEVVQRAIAASPAEAWPRFVRYLTQRRGPDARAEFQEFLQRHRLSSFARLVLQRPA